LARSVVLLDADNMILSHLKLFPDGGMRANTIARRVGRYMQRVASSHGPLESCHATLAMGTLQRPESKGRRDKIALVTHGLVAEGYYVTTVPTGTNAADYALCQIAHEKMRQESIGTYVIATGDGQDPFASLYSELARIGLGVHVVVWDQAPAVLHRYNTFRISRLKEEFQGEFINWPDGDPDPGDEASHYPGARTRHTRGP